MEECKISYLDEYNYCCNYNRLANPKGSDKGFEGICRNFIYIDVSIMVASILVLWHLVKRYWVWIFSGMNTQLFVMELMLIFAFGAKIFFYIDAEAVNKENSSLHYTGQASFYNLAMLYPYLPMFIFLEF